MADVGGAMMKNSHRRNKGQSGSSIIEVALLSPWIFFLFVGIFDFGFYAYAAICTQNAARAVALAAAQPVTGSPVSHLAARRWEKCGCFPMWDLPRLPASAWL